MKNFLTLMNQALLLLGVMLAAACVSSGEKNSEIRISDAPDLKRGDIIVCGPVSEEFGEVEFQTSCSEKVKEDFALAVALLHSFEYDEAEKMFSKVIDADPACAMAYWGVAMSNYHPLWDTPSQTDLQKGSSVITIASNLKSKSRLEKEYIDAIAGFYHDWAGTDHRTRSIKYANAMAGIYTRYPQSKEAAIFYSLALIATADPADKEYVNQKKAGEILSTLYPEKADHPGVVHYIIHAYDNPDLASQALPAARKYASIAPSSAHAQHMPSHIFVRLGLWDEAVRANIASTSSARCYAENAGIDGHWDEELHGLDYLVYAYLQQGENGPAREQYDYLQTIRSVSPVNFKGAYAFAAIPSRWVLENKLWTDASRLELHPKDFPWSKFPWQESIVHFTRLLGFAHTGKTDSARMELTTLEKLHDILMSQKDQYKADQVMVQIEAGKAWISYKEGDHRDAIRMMSLAADREERMEKHPVTPGPVIPARELLGDLLLAMQRPDEALAAYEADLKDQPNRFNGVYGVAATCEMINDRKKAREYYQQLISLANNSASERSELKKAHAFLQNN